MLVPGSNSVTEDPTADLQEATRVFAGVYERHAYLVYNLALRITCEQASAMAAAELAFLSRVGQPESGDELTAAAITAALGSARTHPTPGGAGAPDAEAMLAATADALNAPERAVLAVTDLTGSDPGAAAAYLALDPAVAQRLSAGAFEKLATARNSNVDEAREAYAEWLWAAPPTALWEGLYVKFYRQAEQALHEPEATAAELTQKLPATPPPAQRRRSLSGPKFALALLLPALVVAGAFALQSVRGSQKPASHVADKAATASAFQPADDSGAVPSDPSALLPDATSGDSSTAPAATPKKRKPLTAEQLDKLRRNELRALTIYSKREEDRRLTKAQRDYAAQKIGLLRDLAERRLAADRRERALARAERRAARKERQLERERRAAAKNKGTLNLVQDDGSGDSGGTNTTPKQQPSSGPPQNSQQAQQECLYNPDDGTYICQQ